MQEPGNTIEDMPKWDQRAAASTQHKQMRRKQREHVAQKWHLAQHHTVHQSPRVQLRFPLGTEVFCVTEAARRKQQGEIPCTDATAKLSVAFRQLIYTITNPATDKLGLLTRLVGLKEYVWVSRQPTLKGAPTLRTRV